MRAAHMPGPWLYRPSEYDDWGTVRAAPDAEGRMRHICQARNPAIGHDSYAEYRANGRDPFEANARLIAAAPDLLEALADMFENPAFQVAIGGNPIMVDALMDRARKAIAKARGVT